MAVQIILKNSSTEDKRPKTLANGEISLNYHVDGAFLCCQDTEGNIQQVGGVKISTGAPDTPVRQTLWFNPDTLTLFIFDGDAWQPIGGSGGGGGGGDIIQIIGNDGIDADTIGGIVTLDVELAGGDDGLEFRASKLSASIASETVLGSVKIGDGIDVTSDGTISFDTDEAGLKPDEILGGDGIEVTAGTDSVTVAVDLAGGDDGLEIKSNKLTASVATKSALGSVKIGNGIDIDSDGEISVDIPQTLNYRGSCLLNAPPTGQINPNPPLIGDAYINGVDTSAIDAGWTGLSGAANTGDIVVWDGTEWELIGTGGSQYWERNGTILSPTVTGDKAQTASTIDSDPDATLVTKDYLEDQRVTTSDTAPIAADSRDGDLWWNTNDGRLYVYYEDADSSQWVDASPDSQVSSEYWKRIAGPYLAPDNDGDGIDVGDGKIQLNVDGSIDATNMTLSDAGNTQIRVVRGDSQPTYYVDLATKGTGSSIIANKCGQFQIDLDPTNEEAGTNFQILLDGNVVQSFDDDGTSFFNYSVGIGGIEASPNISLNATDGSITAAGKVTAKEAQIIDTQGSIVLQPRASTAPIAWKDSANKLKFYVSPNGTTRLGSDALNDVKIQLGATNGSSLFAGDMAIGIDGSFTPSTPAISLKAADGSAVFKGDIKTGSGPKTVGPAGAIVRANGLIGSSRTEGKSSTLDAFYVQVASDEVSAKEKVISMFTDGSAKFASGLAQVFSNGTIRVGDNPSSSSSYGIDLNATHNIRIRTTETDALLVYPDSASATPSIALRENGSSYFAGVLDVGTFNSSSNEARGLRAYIDDNRLNLGIQCKAGQGNTNDAVNIREGSTVKYRIKYNGTAAFSNAILNIEADDDTKYTATTNEEGEQTLVYNGATLDVKDRLQKADAALLALKTAAAAAIDFASLQAAIVTALADI